ncbi:flagellar biosynthesis protein FliQ [Candidatus Gottesmanbacteria bacterium]|nr:flagellar biosynthesis protein FliQ [Candidatus Gottesmanbacteria bacterium]
MTMEFVVHIIRQALILILIASAPALIVGLIVGVVISIFQAISQIHEVTLTFIPKIVAIFIALVVFAPWIIRILVSFASAILGNLSGNVWM